MPTFIMLTTLTPEGVQTVKNNPGRIKEVSREVEQLGATVKAQWATLGHFDFVNVVVGAAAAEKPVAAGRDAAVGLVGVGAAAPLVSGTVDALAQAGVAAVGPRAAAARLEGSKAFAKDVMERAGVPAAGARVVQKVDDGLAAIESYPAVLKADGLAAGKGVVIAADEREAREALEAMLVERRFGPTSALVEEHLE